MLSDTWIVSWAVFVSLIVFGTLLYWVRERYRVLYGAMEIVVALGLIYLFVFPQGYVSSWSAEWLGNLGPILGEFLSRAVTLFGGLYALVRELDKRRRAGKMEPADTAMKSEARPPMTLGSAAAGLAGGLEFYLTS